MSLFLFFSFSLTYKIVSFDRNFVENEITDFFDSIVFQDEYFSDELVIRLPRQLCEEVVLEQESKTSGTDKAKVQTKLPPKSKQSKRKREDFEEASYEEEEEEELSDSDGLISSSVL